MRFLFPGLLTEWTARSLGAAAEWFLGKSRFGVERRVRGWMSASRFGAIGLKIDRNLQLEGANALELGDHVTLFGGSHYVGKSDLPIRIGARTHVGRNCVSSGLGGIQIGEDCAISSGVLIYSITHDFQTDPLGKIIDPPPLKQPVSIGSDVWIGAGAKIMPGVQVGDHAIIGAGAVVIQDVEPWKIVAGVPAKVLKDRREAGRTSTSNT